MIRFLTANWIWLVLIVGMFAMHRMHGGGGCGGHGHDQHQETSPRHDQTTLSTDDEPAEATTRHPVGSTTGPAHRHRGC